MSIIVFARLNLGGNAVLKSLRQPKRLLLVLLVLVLSTFIQAIDLKNGLAVVYSDDTAAFVGKNDYSQNITNLIDALADHSIFVDKIDSQDISKGALNYYKLVILPGNSCISQDELALYQEHVNKGGYLIATYDTSLRDKDGQIQEDFLLSDLLGVTLFNFSPQKVIFCKFIESEIFPETITTLTQNSLMVKPKEAALAYGTFFSEGKPLLEVSPLILTDATAYFSEDISLDEQAKFAEALAYCIIHFLGDDSLGTFSISIDDLQPAIDEAKYFYRTIEREFRNAKRVFEEFSLAEEQAYLDAKEVYEALEFTLEKGLGTKAAVYLKQLNELTNLMIPGILPVRKAETRAVWIDYQTFEGAQYPDDFREIVRRLHDANINMIFPETIYNGGTLYPSAVATQHEIYEDLGFDPLLVIINEAHKLGMEVHPWVWTFCGGYWHKFGPILEEHPEWVELDEEGRTFSNWEYGTAWINASHVEAREYLLTLFNELITKYDVDGLHVDYIRYNEDGIGHFGFSDYSKEAFKKDTGLDLDQITIGSRDWIKFNDWREDNVTSFVKEVNEMLKSTDPNLLLSAAVVPDPDHSRTNVLQNWKHWVDNGYLDFVMTMDYRNDTPGFKANAQKGLQVVDDKAWVYPGLGLYVNDRFNNFGQIKSTRTVGATGVALFSNISFTKEKYTDAKEGLFREPSVMPMREPLKAVTLLLEEAIGKLERADQAKALDDEDYAKESYLYQQAVLVKGLLDEYADVEGKLDLDTANELKIALESVIDDLSELRANRVIRGNEHEALLSPILTGKRILSIYIYQNTPKEYIPKTPRTN